jgi:hypothetical protein
MAFNVTKSTRLNDIVSMSRDEKVGTCRQLGLDAKGNKEELVARLWAAIEPQVAALKAEADAAEAAAEAARLEQAAADQSNPRYIEVIDGLKHAVAYEVDKREKEVAKFKESVAKDPVYAMTWHGESVMQAQATLHVLSYISNWLTRGDKTFAEMVEMADEHLAMKFRDLTRVDLTSRSTSAMSNLNEMAKISASQFEIKFLQHIVKSLKLVNSDKNDIGMRASSFHSF